MEMKTQNESNNGEGNVGCLASCRRRLCSAAERVWRSVAGFAGKVAEIARDDPRRVAHSLKVGLALTLASVIYYVTPLFNGFGDSTMWSVITVVFVMQFTVGGTLSKGLNRAVATLVAAFLAVGAHLAASLCGETGEPILLGVFVFLVASAATFSRFIPEIKAKYDYGVIIFILTYSLVAVSSYRVEDIFKFAQQRFTTIVIGVAACLSTSVFVFPIWAGEDLHKLAAANLDKLAEFLEGMESEYLGVNSSSENLEGKAFLHAYKNVLNSKEREDILSMFARWEPSHGKFIFRHPWDQYQKLGALCRQCATTMEALASYVITLTKCQPEANPELCLKFRTACAEISSHSAKALRELSSAIQTMIISSPTSNNMSVAIEVANRLRGELSNDATALLQVIHVPVIGSLPLDIVSQITKITESVDNLARLAGFKSPKKGQEGVIIEIVS
ncbi:hypothetical protein ACP70R_009560 [Stipagrostis hirtigluma subsp. patula]